MEENDPGSAGDAMIDFLSDDGFKSDSTTEAGSQQIAELCTLITENGTESCHIEDRRWDKVRLESNSYHMALKPVSSIHAHKADTSLLVENLVWDLKNAGEVSILVVQDLLLPVDEISSVHVLSLILYLLMTNPYRILINKKAPLFTLW